MMAAYWLARRALYRWRWRSGRCGTAEFFAALEGAPRWLRKSTIPMRVSAWRWLQGHPCP